MAAKFEDIALKDVSPEMYEKLSQQRTEFLGDVLTDALGMLAGPAAVISRIDKFRAITKVMKEVGAAWEHLPDKARKKVIGFVREMTQAHQMQFDRLSEVVFDPKFKRVPATFEPPDISRAGAGPSKVVFGPRSQGAGDWWHEGGAHAKTWDEDDFVAALSNEIVSDYIDRFKRRPSRTMDVAEGLADALEEELMHRLRSTRAAELELLYPKFRARAIKKSKETFIDEDEWHKMIKKLIGRRIYE